MASAGEAGSLFAEGVPNYEPRKWTPVYEGFLVWRRERDTRRGRGKFAICPVTLSERLSGSRVEILTHGLEVSREVSSPLAQAVQRRARTPGLRRCDSGRSSHSVGDGAARKARRP